MGSVFEASSGRPALLPRSYLASRRRFVRGLDLAAALFEGFWLGLLREADLAKLDEMVYESLTEVHDGERVTYADEAYTRSGMRPAERHLVERNFPAGGRILVTGAGGGREVLALLDAGFDAYGLEPNARLVTAGNHTLESLGHGERLHLMPRSAMPPGRAAERYDALVVGWTSYTLMAGSSARIAFLRTAVSHLVADAPVLLSTWVRDERDAQAKHVALVAAKIRRVRRSREVEEGDGLAPNFVHRFTGEELGREIAAAGLTAVDQALDEHLWVVARATTGRRPPAE